ncbi:MAG TPA: hypothetical protein VMH87_09520 [Pseudomonadales bacterium]|nr:hypothetical protein [Pseudomonadales bacterium]
MQPFLKLWIWVSAFATFAGWTLSACGQLNRMGYAVAFVAFAIFIFLCRRDLGFAREKRFSIGQKFFRRFRRPLPFCFLALAVLIFISGAIYLPDNYTGLTYRAGRVLQWLSHGHWFWIHTTDSRMNDRACGIEWLTAPILLFTKSTRALFLLNFLPFLLLPGLIFSVFTRLGVSPRVARQWMWLLPTGYTFLLQAGGNANDAFPTVYALAAVDYALRARESRQASALWHSFLAAALLTGAKASNLPLLLPWAIVILPALPLLTKKIAVTALVALVAAVVSFLPTAILNSVFCGDWSGAVLERPVMTIKNPLIGIIGNSFQLLVGNFCPPIFPFASWWNAHATEIVPRALVSVSTHFDIGFFQLGELPMEDSAGVGLGLSLLLAVSVMANFFIRPVSVRVRPPCVWAMVASWIALLVYAMKSGMITAERLIAPYYPLLIPLLLIGAGQSQIVRRSWWNILVGFTLLMALVVLVLLPDRPLWPAQTILGKLAEKHPENHLIVRAREVYAVYAKRSDPLPQVRALLPPGIKVVGFIGAEDDNDISFWLPLGSRRVEQFLLTDPPERYRQQGVEYAVVSKVNLDLRDIALDDWLKKTDARVVATTNGILKVAEGVQPWYIVRIGP